MSAWIYLVVVVIAAVAAYAMAPKPPEPTHPMLKDINAPTAEEGRNIPVVFGTWVIKSPNIVYYGDLGYKAVKSKGGK